MRIGIISNKCSQYDFIDIVIQGIATNYTIETARQYIKLSFVNKVIVSCWTSCSFDPPDNDKIIIHRNVDILIPGQSNINRQLCSTRAGLDRVRTLFCAKMRSDQRYELNDMLAMYNFYKKNKSRRAIFHNDASRPRNIVCVNGVFSTLPFHPSDHLFWGNTLDIKDIFNIPYSTDTTNERLNPETLKIYTRPETYIGTYYCSRFVPRVADFIKDYKNYLVDEAQYIDEAMILSNAVTKNVFLPFQKLGFHWPKYYDDLHSHNDISSKVGNTWSI